MSLIERVGAKEREYVMEVLGMGFRTSANSKMTKRLETAFAEKFESKYAIDRLLDIHYMNDISLTFLSEKLFVSPQNITKIISAAYGKSFNELKQELKMRNAKKMLRETKLSAGEIGERIGYTTKRGFFSAFLKYEGCTPGEYRKNCDVLSDKE